jgi:hypothetical protein
VVESNRGGIPDPDEWKRIRAAKELSNDDRDLLDKSQLLLAETWAQTDGRDKVAEGKLILRILQAFSSSLGGNSHVQFRDQEKVLEGYFKEEFRPTLFAWIASQNGIRQEIADATRELEGSPDREFLEKHIARLERSLKTHELKREMLMSFINNLRVTDVKQNRFIYKKLCCPCSCCTSASCPSRYRQLVLTLRQEGDQIQVGFESGTMMAAVPAVHQHVPAAPSPHAAGAAGGGQQQSLLQGLTRPASPNLDEPDDTW